MAKYLTCQDIKLMMGGVELPDITELSYEFKQPSEPLTKTVALSRGAVKVTGLLSLASVEELEMFFGYMRNRFLADRRRNGCCYKCGLYLNREQRVKVFPGGGKGVYVHKLGCWRQYKAEQRLMRRGVLSADGKLIKEA